MTIVAEESKGVGQVVNIERFSTAERLLRVTSWVLRFLHNLKQKVRKEEPRSGCLKAEEMIMAEKMWIKDAQKLLRRSVDYEKMRVQLGVIESEGVLVCKGRLENSDLEIDSRYPIILPKEHRLTELIVLDCHERVHHSKVRATLAEIRSRFWITRGRQYVKKIIRPCFRCKLMEGKAFNNPATAALPGFRVREAPPFSSTGVDFAGPLLVKGDKGEMVKAYIALFTCCVTRAVHLEFVMNLTASTFLNSLRRFCARRGTPGLMVSDNAKTFKSAEKVLRKVVSDGRVENLLRARRITWRFNLERTPWWGGFFERMVGNVKGV
eukprot:gene18426-biopygen12365